MYRHLRIIAVFTLSVFLLTSCNSKPDHRKYIPKDASVVAGINLSALSKKIAWNMITGSKLFKEMEKRVPNKNGSDVMSGIDKAGIDVLNTFYVYIKPDNRFNAGMTVTALVPLSDADAWEAYIKKSFPNSTIQSHNKLKVTNLDGNMYLGWDKHLLIVMNAMTGSEADMLTELDNAFNISDDNSIKADKHFEQLQSAGHDLSLWVNYGQIMNNYNDRMAPSMAAGVNVSKTMWKETAFACGFDFVKGKITGDMAYYTSKSLEELYKEFGSKNVDKDLLARMPGKELDFLMATHFSTKAMRAMMDSTGMLGIANATLQQQGTNMDNILDAFTGDMAFCLNGLNVSNSTGPEAMSPFQYNSYCMSFVMKINKKDNFDKLMSFAATMGMTPIAGGYMVPVSAKDSVFVIYNNDYAVFSNKLGNAGTILSGKNDQPIADAVASEIKKHPFGMFLDVQETVSKLDFSKAMSSAETDIYDQSRKLLSNISINGGEFKDGASRSHLEINFSNKDENSIIILLDYGMKVSDAVQKAEMAPVVPDTAMTPPAM